MENLAYWKKWLIAISIFLCAGIGVVVSPIVQTLAEVYPGTSMTMVRSITTVPSLISFLCSFFIGATLGRKLPYKPAILFGISLCLVGGILPVFWNQKFIYILISRVLFGFGMAVFSSRNAIITKAFGVAEAAKWMGYGMMITNIVSVVGQLISGMVGDVNWKFSFAMYFVCALALIPIILWFKEPEKEVSSSPEKENSGKKGHFLHPMVFVFFAITLIGVLCSFPVLSSISNFVAERGLGTAAQASLGGSAYTLGGALISAFFGRIYPKLSRWIMPLSCLTAIAGYIMVLAAGNIAMVVIGCALLGAGYICIMLTCSQWAMGVSSPESRTFAMTLISCAVSGGSFISSYFILFAKKVGSFIPLFETEMEKTFLIGIILYIIILVFTLVKDLRPKTAEA